MRLFNSVDMDKLIDFVRDHVDDEYIAQKLDKDALLDNLTADDCADHFGLEVLEHFDKSVALSYLGVSE